MPRHKTAHRKLLEAHQKEQTKLLSAELAAQDEMTLKPNALKNLKAATRASKSK